MPLETAIDGLCAPDALSTEIDSRNNHKLQIWFHDAPDSNFIEEIAARALSQQEQADIQLEFVPEHDWLAENRKSFPPLTIGCFWIYGSHVTAPAPKTLLPILIDAAQAFGSGTHPTTEGCLRALKRYSPAKTPSAKNSGYGMWQCHISDCCQPSISRSWRDGS